MIIGSGTISSNGANGRDGNPSLIADQSRTYLTGSGGGGGGGGGGCGGVIVLCYRYKAGTITTSVNKGLGGSGGVSNSISYLLDGVIVTVKGSSGGSGGDGNNGIVYEFRMT